MPKTRKGAEALTELADKFGGPSVPNLPADELTEEATDILNSATRHRQNPAVVVDDHKALSENEGPSTHHDF